MTTRKEILAEILDNLSLIKRKIMAEGHNFSEKTGITHAQAHVLFIVRQHKGIGIKEISEMLGTSSSATTQLVEGLVYHHLLIKECDTEDKRALKLNLSDSCKLKIAKIRMHGIEKIQESFASLTDKEIEQFLNLSKKVTDSIIIQNKEENK